MSQLDDLLERTLTERAARAPGGDGVAERVLAAAPARRRWRSGATVLAGLAAAGVVVAAVLVLPGDRTSSGADVGPASPPEAHGRTLIYHGVQFTVPRTWPGTAYEAPACYLDRGTVYVAVPGPRPFDCDNPYADWTHVEVREASRFSPASPALYRTFEVDGVEVRLGVRREGWCPPTALCGRPPKQPGWYGLLVVPDRDVVVQAQAQRRAPIRALFASVAFPDMSAVVVPDVEGLSWGLAADRLTRLGLGAPGPEYRPGALVVETFPAAGEPAPADGTVEVRLARPTRTSG